MSPAYPLFRSTVELSAHNRFSAAVAERSGLCTLSAKEPTFGQLWDLGGMPVHFGLRRILPNLLPLIVNHFQTALSISDNNSRRFCPRHCLKIDKMADCPFLCALLRNHSIVRNSDKSFSDKRTLLHFGNSYILLAMSLNMPLALFVA